MSNTLTKGYTFGSTELVTNAKLHALVDNGTATIDTVAVSSSSANTFTIGDGAAGNKSIAVNNGDANLPNLRFNDTSNKWEFSNNGTTWAEMGSSATVDGSTFVNLASINASAGIIPNANLPTISSAVRGAFNYGSLVSGILTVISLPSVAFPYTRNVSLVRANASVNEMVIPDNFTFTANAMQIDLRSYLTASNASISFGYIY